MRRYLYLFIIILSISKCPILLAQHRCIASEQRSIESIKISNQVTSTSAVLSSSSIQTRSLITIPVVVHVLWNQPIENISDEQILSQIEILNQDFRAENNEIANIPSVFQPFIADTEIEFCLAKVDPNGNPTNGITRKFTPVVVGIGGTSAIHYSSLGGQDTWDSEKYLNIWVAKFAGNIGGTGSFPGTLAAEDGVEVNFLQFGNIDIEPPYHLGRTLTHEIGHYLNLEHPWGPNITDCCEDDYVDDTPEACDTYLSICPTHPVISCSGPDMFMNFMFYSNDACLGMFTLGQKERMHETLNTFRKGLLNSDACNPVSISETGEVIPFKIFPNPASNYINVQAEGIIETPLFISIFDINGRVVLSGEKQLNSSTKIDLSNLKGGFYLIELMSKNKIWVEKLMVQ